MATNLVIVESCAKAKTISKYLNGIPELASRGKFVVMASMGHIQDLPAKRLGVDKDSWAVEYELNKGKGGGLLGKLAAEAKESLASGGKVYLASDMDLEGHAIADHLRSFLKLKQRHQYERVVFNEITKGALKEAFLHPSDVDADAVAAQETRRILDRVVGYELSPLLWNTFGTYTLSAGRVQSAALNLVIMRAAEIDSHVYETYWKCHGVFELPGGSSSNQNGGSSSNQNGGGSGNASLLETSAKEKWTDAAHAKASITYIAKIPKTSWKAAFAQTKSLKKPQPPFTTSTLQQECYSRFNIPAKSTMKYAQTLYEAGLITYMRTDSTSLSQDAQTAIVNYITNTFGQSEVQARTYQTKNASAQEAHEAIRPSNPAVTSSADVFSGEAMTASHKKIYDLIWRRAIASQMVPATYTDVSYTIKTVTKDEAVPAFTGKTSILMEAGFMAVYMPETKPNPDALKAWNAVLEAPTNVQVYSKSFEMTGDISRPKPYYNEASFVKVLETEGIGRPSTYSSVVEKLFDKGYVIKNKANAVPIHEADVKTYKAIVGNASGATLCVETTHIRVSAEGMVPTDVGKQVVTYIGKVTPYMIDPTFTKLMESDLDKISKRETSKKKILDDFYSTFGKSVAKASLEPKAPRKSANGGAGAGAGAGAAPLVEFAKLDACIKETRYGPALYHTATKKFYSVDSFLEWQAKSATQLSEQDARFIMSLPKPVSSVGAGVSGNTQLAIGRYGMYVIVDGKNQQLPKELWQKGYDGTLTKEDIAATPLPPKSEKSYGGTKRSPGAPPPNAKATHRAYLSKAAKTKAKAKNAKVPSQAPAK